MFRSLSTIAIVAALSMAISGLEHAQADRGVGPDWVRTVDGWEHTAVLAPGLQPSTPPALHPFLVAGFELGASLFVLLAFPHVPQAKPMVVDNVRIARRRKLRREAVSEF